VENLVSTLADRTLAERHETYAAEIRTLLDAALTVMRAGETIDPRVSDIVRTAGLSNQAFYRHFRGKDELLVALLDDGRQRLLATIERRMARATTPPDQVRAWVEAVLAQARSMATGSRWSSPRRRFVHVTGSSSRCAPSSVRRRRWPSTTWPWGRCTRRS
jgi:AcrR family transcriptional regulator